MPSLSLLYMVRNEERTLPTSIASAEAIADQVIVVDTGSADQTPRAARNASRKAKVVPYKWCHDFSKARNHGLQHCSGDWVMCLDADEVIDQKTAESVRKAIESASPNTWGLALKVVDCPKGLDGEAIKSFFRSPQVRVFRRLPEVRFEGAVTESVEPSISRAGAGVDLVEGSIRHWLWRGKGREFAAMKVNYYRRLGATLPDPGDIEPQPESEEETPRQAKPGLAIVVAGYDCVAHTRQCLAGVRSRVGTPCRLILVDNGSSDETASVMRDAAEPGDVISFPRNQGLAKARNAAIDMAMRDPAIRLVCFMDNDCIPSKGAIEEMARVLESDEGLAAVGPVSNAAPGVQAWNDKASMDEVDEGLAAREPDRSEVTVLAGFCMMAKAGTLRRVGGFDESLPGKEAEDFCARLKAAGLRMAVANRAYVMHRGRVTMTAHPGVDWYSMKQTSEVRFREKWHIEREETRARRLQAEKAKAGLPEYARAAPVYTRKPLVPARATQAHPWVDIVILTHNRLDMTRPCVESITRNTTNYRLIFVDNASTDGTTEYLGNVPGAVLIRNDRNVGIPKARNQGIRASTAPYVVLMDNDIEVKPGWLEELFSGIRGGASMVGIEGWKLDKGWAACAKCASPTEHFDYLGGACTLFDRKVFEVAGLLDEGYGRAYYEDVCISIRAKECGFRLAFDPTPLVVHKQHATLVHGQKDFDHREALAASHDRFARRMRGELKVEYEKLPKASRKLRILYLGMKWDYGDRARGTSYEHDNFYPSLLKWDRTEELRHFDFVELSKVHGIARMSEMLLKEAAEFAPDAVFSVFFDEGHDPKREAMTALKQACGARTINWFCDSHYRYDNFDSRWAPYLDFCVTTSSVALQKYARDGFGGKAIKSQWFASPGYVKIEGVEKDVGVSFVGQPHGDRREVIQKLRSAGINVETYGTGWGRRLSFDEMVMMFNRTRINLNLNNAADARHKQIKGRNFEVPGCGGFILTGDAENLAEYYEPGREVAVFANVTDLIEKVRYYLKNEKEREEVAKAGHERTMREHTSAKRLDAIFSQAGLL